MAAKKGATDSTSLLFEASKSRIDVCAGKGGEDRGKEEETGGCPRLAASQTGLELKKEKKRAFIRKEVRRWTEVQSNGPKSIANKNEKNASKKIGSPLFEARIQEKTLEKDQAHLLAQSSLKQGLY